MTAHLNTVDEKERTLRRIIQLGVEVSQIKDLDVLLETVLREARALVDADAGSIYIKEGDHLHFRYAQNDTFQRRLGAGRKLPYLSFSLPVSNRSIAGYAAWRNESLNIPDVRRMSNRRPYTFDQSIDEKTDYVTHSMLTVPLNNSQGHCIGVLQLINARDRDGCVATFSDDDVYIAPFALYAAVAIERAQQTRTTLLRMISMAELRDPKETGPHVNRVASYAVEIYELWAHKKDIPQDERDSRKDALRMAGMLHDVGKIGISDLILKKPGRFTEDEHNIMKQHTVLGARLFSGARSESDEIAAEVAFTHHERWDGTGYPGFIDIKTDAPLPGFTHPDGTARGKREAEIPIFGRIVSLADVYDALSCRRVYKEAWYEDHVLDTLYQGRGSQFDPEVVDVFLDNMDVMRSIAARYPDE